MLNGLDLFSGIGGLSLALAPWVRPVAYCENDRYAQGVLLSRQANGDLPSAPIWEDVTTFPSSNLVGGVDIIYGGFPCQDISIAGAGRGLAGERSGLVFEIFRLIDELRPTFVFLENVPAIRTRGGERVGKELARRGFDCRWTVVSAAEVGAPHLRKRWFLLAYSDGFRRGCEIKPQSELELDLREPTQLRNRQRKARPQMGALPHSERNGLQVAQHERSGEGTATGRRRSANKGGEMAYATSLQPQQGHERAGTNHPGHSGERALPGQSEVLADTDSVNGRQRHSVAGGGGERIGEDEWARLTDGGGGWAIEPDVGRVAHGVPARVDRLRGLGNAVVPLQARTAFARLAGFKETGGF